MRACHEVSCAVVHHIFFSLFPSHLSVIFVFCYLRQEHVAILPFVTILLLYTVFSRSFVGFYFKESCLAVNFSVVWLLLYHIVHIHACPECISFCCVLSPQCQVYTLVCFPPEFSG